MTPTRKYLLAGAALGILGLTACSSLPSFNFGGKAKELAEAEKAGRITMVLSDDQDRGESGTRHPENQPAPGAGRWKAWTQAGANAEKVIGHIKAAETLIGRLAHHSVGKGLREEIRPLHAARRQHNHDLYARREPDCRCDRPIIQRPHAVAQEAERPVPARQGRARRRTGGRWRLADRLVSGFGYVTALDASTGEEKWKNPMSAPMTGAPTIKDGRIFVESNNNEIFALAMDAAKSNGPTRRFPKRRACSAARARPLWKTSSLRRTPPAK
jgi:outer membrane protein assembly factor BamB